MMTTTMRSVVCAITSEILKPYFKLNENSCPSVIRENLYVKQFYAVQLQLQKTFEKLNLTDEDVTRKKKEIVDAFQKKLVKSFAQPGDSVGILCAHAIGEKQTQKTLDHFH